MTASTTVTYGDCSDYSMTKFQKNIDQLAYEESLGGFADDEEGTTEYNGHIALVTITSHDAPTAEESAYWELTANDLAFLSEQSSVIVETHTSGAVYVEWFTDADTARARFDTIRGNYATPEDWEY